MAGGVMSGLRPGPSPRLAPGGRHGNYGGDGVGLLLCFNPCACGSTYFITLLISFVHSL